MPRRPQTRSQTKPVVVVDVDAPPAPKPRNPRQPRKPKVTEAFVSTPATASPLRVMSIDPGTRCMAWTITMATTVVEWGIVDLTVHGGEQNKNTILDWLTRATGIWMRKFGLDLMRRVDKVIIEQQYESGFATFPPRIVQIAIYSIAVYEGINIAAVSPMAVKSYFKFRMQGHAANKKEACERFPHLMIDEAGNRQHDLIDCQLNTQYWLERFYYPQFKN